jgi:hypothetical protein
MASKGVFDVFLGCFHWKMEVQGERGKGVAPDLINEGYREYAKRMYC